MCLGQRNVEKKVCPFLLENSRPLSPCELQTPFSSSGTLDFLSTYLEIDCLSGREMMSSTWDLLNLRMAWDLQMEMLSKHPYKETCWNPWLGEWPATFSVSSTLSSRGCWPWWPVRFSSDSTLSLSWLCSWSWLPSMPCWPRPSMQASFCATTTWTTAESKCPPLCSKKSSTSSGKWNHWEND